MQSILNWLAPRYKTDEEQEAEDLREQSEELWGGVTDDQPTVDDLMGYGLYGGQAPQDYVDAYLAEQGLTGNAPGHRGRGPAGDGRTSSDPARETPGFREQQISDATQAAQMQWVQEQLAQNPLFGLNVNDESALAGAGADPASIAAQRRALGQMQGIYDAGGYTDSERAQLQMAQRDAAMGER
jgi:hypothetical protein